MKKLLLGTVGLIALGVAPVSAADLAARPYYTKAPPPMMAPAYDWSGFYIGGNAGYGQGRDCRTNDATGFGLGCYNPRYTPLSMPEIVAIHLADQQSPA